MGKARGFRVVVGTDGSIHGRAAVAMAVAFPWPPRAQVVGVVARISPGRCRGVAGVPVGRAREGR
jgi:hypothetical protein